MLTPGAGRCALITGASSGIGQATAERLAELGCRLVVAARRKDRLDALAEKLAKDIGTKVHCVALDVTDVDAVMSLPSQLPDDFKDVSILVNNAGGALGTAKCTENNMDDVSVMLDANVKGVIACTRAFSPGMVERGCGHVVNISSIAGVEWYGGGSVYCATKAAINAFTYASKGPPRYPVQDHVRLAGLCQHRVRHRSVQRGHDKGGERVRGNEVRRAADRGGYRG